MIFTSMGLLFSRVLLLISPHDERVGLVKLSNDSVDLSSSHAFAMSGLATVLLLLSEWATAFFPFAIDSRGVYCRFPVLNSWG